MTEEDLNLDAIDPELEAVLPESRRRILALLRELRKEDEAALRRLQKESGGSGL